MIQQLLRRRDFLVWACFDIRQKFNSASQPVLSFAFLCSQAVGRSQSVRGLCIVGRRCTCSRVNRLKSALVLAPLLWQYPRLEFDCERTAGIVSKRLRPAFTVYSKGNRIGAAPFASGAALALARGRFALAGLRYRETPQCVQCIAHFRCVTVLGCRTR